MSDLADREDAFLFSVIVPIYNTEKYLEETIKSVLDQDIGFEENIQLILVNNASTDGSGDICKRYLELYPDNILYIELEINQRPNGAKNAGIPYVRGKYVNFLDSDDKWSRDAFRKAWNFFEKHGEQIDVIACRMKFFDGKSGYHALDYKFNRDRIIDIFKEFDCVQLHMASCILRRDAIFNERYHMGLHSGEDSRLIAEIILKKKCYGILRSVVYFYRKRVDGTSELQNFQKYKKYFSTDLELHPLYLSKLSKDLFAEVIPYIQFHMMYTIQWRLKEPFPYTLSRKQFSRYIQLVRRVLSMVDDSVIMGQRNIYKEQKLFALRLKYGSNLRPFLQNIHGKLCFNNIPVMDFRMDTQVLNIFIVEQKGKELLLEGKVNVPLEEDAYQIFARAGFMEYIPEYYPLNAKETIWSLGHVILVRRGFRFRIPLQDGDRISFILRYNQMDTEIRPSFGFWAKLTYQMNTSYFCGKDYLVFRDGKGIAIRTRTEEALQYAEEAYRAELRKKKQKDALRLRTLALAWKKKFTGKKIWLFVDRVSTADDNAEYLLDYVQQQERSDLLLFYVLREGSPDIERMRKKANVVIYGSMMYRLLYLQADMIISALADRFVYEFFGNQKEYLKNMFHYQYIYLQHGVIKDDLSSTYNYKFKDNAQMFVTSAWKEYQSMLEYPYGYSEKEIRLTGLARYDAIATRFHKTPCKRILLAPTWRKNLASPAKDTPGEWEYEPQFTESFYFQFYNRLMNDNRILESMMLHGYRGGLRLHPAAVRQAKYYSFPECFELDDRTERYEDDIINTAMIITDYSSLAIDYAYAKRRVIYTQFDAEEFYKNHTYHKGYFDYERDGFGPVCYDYESTVAAILQAMEEDCVMEKVYQDRVDSFFAYRDTHNCERIYNEILKLEQETSCSIS